MERPDRHAETKDELSDQIAEVRERLKRIEEDPEDLLAVGVVIAYTDETTEMCGHEGHDHVTDGMVVRLLNPTAHEGYDDIGSLMQDIHTFDEQCEEIKLEGGDRQGPEVMGVSLDDLLGGGSMP